MKKDFLPLLLFLAAACTNTIPYDFGQVEPQLMVVGWLDQASSEQTLRISLSEGGLVVPVEDARVVCAVNGTEVADVSGKAAEHLSFPLSLRPGDLVRLSFEANQGVYKATSALLTVPEPVAISRVDTARVTIRYTDWSERYLQVHADIPDRKGEDNWYSISLREITEGTYSFRDGGPDLVVTVDSPRYIMEMDDPILLDGNGASSNEILDYTGNGEFACFSDRQFRDAMAHIRMNAFSSWNNEGVDFESLGRELVKVYGPGLDSREPDSCTARHWLEARLSHCSQEAYDYLRALRTLSSRSYRPEIVEPVVIPSNIEGGVGFVSIVHTASARIELPSEILRY